VSGQIFRALGNVDREIPDTLQIIVHFQNDDDIAKIGGDGLVQRENFQALILDNHFLLIEIVVTVYDFLSQVLVGGHERDEGLVQILFDSGAVGKQPFAERVNVFDQVSGHGEKSSLQIPMKETQKSKSKRKTDSGKVGDPARRRKDTVFCYRKGFFRLLMESKNQQPSE
jgi:hypothetical protein